MYNIRQKDYFCLLNMLDAIDKIRQYSSPFTSANDFGDATQAFDACLMNFIVIGEMVEKLLDELTDAAKMKLTGSK